MASEAKASNVQRMPPLPLRRPSIATRNRRETLNSVKAERTRSGGIFWDLDSLQAVRNAADRVRQSHDAWQHQIFAAEELEQLERQRKLGLFHAERERREATQRAVIDATAARAAEEQRLIADAQETAHQAALAAETARLVEEDERRQLEAEQRRIAEEERRRAENEMALIFAQEEEDRQRRIVEEEHRRAENEIAAILAREEEEERLRRLEIEAAAEAARAAEDAEQRRRQAQAEHQRRARLRNCAACLEQHDVADMTQVACEHWYCHSSLRGRRIDIPSLKWEHAHVS